MLQNTRYQMGVAPFFVAAGALASRLLWPAVIVGGGTLLLSSQVGEKLTAGLGIDPVKLRNSILLGGAGAAAFAAGPLLPESFQPVATIAGIAGLVGSAVVLLAPSGRPAEDGPPTAAAALTPEEFSGITMVFQSPRPLENVDTSFFGGNYPVQVVVSNASPKVLNVILELIATERMFMPWGEIGRPEQRLVASRLVTVPAGGNKVESFEVGLIRTRVPGSSFSVDLAANKRRTAQESPVRAASVYFVV